MTAKIIKIGSRMSKLEQDKVITSWDTVYNRSFRLWRRWKWSREGRGGCRRRICHRSAFTRKQI